MLLRLDVIHVEGVVDGQKLCRGERAKDFTLVIDVLVPRGKAEFIGSPGILKHQLGCQINAFRDAMMKVYVLKLPVRDAGQAVVTVHEAVKVVVKTVSAELL